MKRKNKTKKICFWPAWFYHDLTGRKLPLSRSDLKILEQANLDLWRALNIYDDFLDQEGRPSDLPLGNGYYRRFLTAYYRLDLPIPFYQIMEKILDKLDKANRNETLYYRARKKKDELIFPSRLPGWKNIDGLADKSLALALSPIAILYLFKKGKSDKQPNDRRIKATLNFFRFALTAKQLADDAGDWREDLAKGRLTPANALIVRAAREKNIKLDLRHDPTTACLIFATEASRPISDRISELGRKAKKAAGRAGLKENGYLINNIIRPLEAAVEETNDFRRRLADERIKML